MRRGFAGDLRMDSRLPFSLNLGYAGRLSRRVIRLADDLLRSSDRLVLR